jgi:flagella basal body P-ring formation protein FlgA
MIARPEPAWYRDPALRMARNLIGAGAMALAAALLAATLRPADAAELRPSLKLSVEVVADVVTVGDFFENAGDVAEKPLFRAPDIGTTGTVPAWKVLELARAAGLTQAESAAVAEVPVTRLGREIGAMEVSKLIAAEGARQTLGDPADLKVTFEQPFEPRQADTRSRTPVRIANLAWVSQTGRFEALVTVDKGASIERVRVRGDMSETADVLTLVRPLNRGEIVTKDDVQVERQPKRVVGAFRAVDPNEIVGLAAKRQLRPGQPVVPSDFNRPLLVNRGETVLIVYESPGLVLSARGQALESGAKGDLVPVINPQSKRIVHGSVAGPGRVLVNAAGGTVASLGRAAQ